MLFFPLIHVKMPTIVGILTYMSGENFMLIWVEHEKSFITSGPGCITEQSIKIVMEAGPKFSLYTSVTLWWKDGLIEGWIDDLGLYILFISISVVSKPWADDNERLCAREPHLRLRRFRLQRGSNSGLLDRPALNPLSYRGSCVTLCRIMLVLALKVICSIKRALILVLK